MVGYKTFSDMYSFTFQKDMNCTLKGHLSQRKRCPFTSPLIINKLASKYFQDGARVTVGAPMKVKM